MVLGTCVTVSPLTRDEKSLFVYTRVQRERERERQVQSLFVSLSVLEKKVLIVNNVPKKGPRTRKLTGEETRLLV